MTAQVRYGDLDGAVALVTGGSRGLGAEVCRTLAANGASVVVSGRDGAAIASVVGEIEAAGGRALGLSADCTDPDDLERLRGTVEERLGPVQLLAAFAGGDGPEVPLIELEHDGWQRVIEVNLTATFLTLKTFLPAMISRRRGAVVLMSSTAARRQTAASAAYTAAKAGIIALGRKAAAEVGEHGVRVNCVVPSLIPTENRVLTLSEQQIAAGWPLGRLGAPRDVANATAFLLSDASGWITGIALDVAGGRVMP